MSRPITLSSAIEKARLDSDVPYLMLLEIFVYNVAAGQLVNTIRAVKDDKPFTFEGNEFLPNQFNLTINEQSGRLANAQLSINDFTRALRQQEELYQGKAGSFKVRILVVNADLPNESPDVDLTYDVVSSSAKEYIIQWNLGSDNIFARTFPARRQNRWCANTFRDEDCQYVGPLETCDLTLDGDNGCTRHNNVIHFRGFPNLSS